MTYTEPIVNRPIRLIREFLLVELFKKYGMGIHKINRSSTMFVAVWLI